MRTRREHSPSASACNSPSSRSPASCSPLRSWSAPQAAPRSIFPGAVFAAVLISGASTVLQAVRFGRIGAGYVLLMGTSGAFIAVCITALAEGGPGMLATLVAISSLGQFSLSMNLSFLRRLLTPTVAGTVIMLIPVTVMPIIFDMLSQTPAEWAPEASPVSALATILVIAAIRPQGARGVPALGARHRHRRRFCGRRILRPLRPEAGPRSILGRTARGRAGPGWISASVPPSGRCFPHSVS